MYWRWLTLPSWRTFESCTMHLPWIHSLLHLLEIIITELYHACSSTAISIAGFCSSELCRFLYTVSCTSASKTMLAKQYKPIFSTLCRNSQLTCFGLKFHWKICIAEPNQVQALQSLLLRHLKHLCFGADYGSHFLKLHAIDFRGWSLDRLLARRPLLS